MKVHFTNIEWDTDGEDICYTIIFGDIDLPSEVIREVDDDVQLETEGADIIGDEFGWCVKSFDFTVLK